MNQGPYSNHGTDLRPDSFGGEDFPSNPVDGVQPRGPERPRRDVIPPPAQVARVGRPAPEPEAEPSLRPAPTIAVTRRVVHTIRGCDIAAEWARCFNVVPRYTDDSATVEVSESLIRPYLGRGRNTGKWAAVAGDAASVGQSDGGKCLAMHAEAALALLVRRNLIPCGDYLIDTRGREAL